MQIRTGIFGGSFNPVHAGHTGLARHLLEQGFVDEVWLMVSPRNPLKQSATLASEADRLHMARLAVAQTPGIEASDFEFTLPRPSYTAHTLRRLVRAFPDRRFSLIVGADNWRVFRLWREHGYILRHYPLIVYPRGGQLSADNGLDLTDACGVRLIAAPEFPFSSTQVREALHASDSRVADMIAPEVLAYIREKNLYTSPTEK
ncbi:MAG: nicotinate (nicotinamide) nucleotide adenylyltransferase [Prevotellaceae bacterium]|nr:nicotinate (nicotinamide) nucleotide adenylyltransferase [Prevotellaceae bacterium]